MRNNFDKLILMFLETIQTYLVWDILQNMHILFSCKNPRMTRPICLCMWESIFVYIHSIVFDYFLSLLTKRKLHQGRVSIYILSESYQYPLSHLCKQRSGCRLHYENRDTPIQRPCMQSLMEFAFSHSQWSSFIRFVFWKALLCCRIFY